MHYVPLDSGVSGLGYRQLGFMEAILTVAGHNVDRRCFFSTVAMVRVNMSVNN